MSLLFSLMVEMGENSRAMLMLTDAACEVEECSVDEAEELPMRTERRDARF